jgi:flagellar biosynthesis/type III secretory pathway protein FliH
MSALIKSSDEAHGFVIRKLGIAVVASAASKQATPVHIENPLAAEIRRLLALLEEREAEIEGHADALTKALTEGEEAGRLAMEAEIDDDRAASLALLGEGIEVAKAKLSQVLENAESIALMVAQIALDKMFGEPEARKAAAADLIRHQFRQIGFDSFVAIEVSRADYPNTSEVAELAASISVASDRVNVSDDLEAGSCRMRLQLGTLEIGLDHQWKSIRALLMTMAAIAKVEEVK